MSTPCSQGDSCDEHQYILTLLIITHLCILAENDLVSQGGGGGVSFSTTWLKAKLSGNFRHLAALYSGPHPASLSQHPQNSYWNGAGPPPPSAFPQSHQSGYLILVEQDIISALQRVCFKKNCALQVFEYFFYFILPLWNRLQICSYTKICSFVVKLVHHVAFIAAPLVACLNWRLFFPLFLIAWQRFKLQASDRNGPKPHPWN